MTTGGDDDAIERAIDALYQLPRSEFIAARKELAASHRADRERFARLSRLAKPSITAWAVNRVYWRSRELYDRLCAAALAVASQQSAGDADGLRAAMKERRDALDAAVAAAERELADAGHATGLATMRKVSQTLDALAAWAGRDDGPHPGRLTGNVDPPGLDLLAALADAAPPPEPRPESRAEPKKPSPAERRAELARAEMREADAEVEVRTREVARAAEARDRAAARAAELEQKVDEAAARLAELEAKLAAAQREARDARAAARKAAAAETRARRRLERARDRLSGD